MNALNDEDQDTIALARRYLGEYPRPWPDKARAYNPKTENHLRPQALLQAAFDYAPTRGRLNIARVIVEAHENPQLKSFNTSMEDLSAQIYSDLLIPSPFSQLRH
jgi:hypothetical protein